MRAITIRQPHAWAIVWDLKDVENRSRNIAGAYRGPVAIHAGMADAERTPEVDVLDEAWRQWWTIQPWPGGYQRGAIIGVVDLADVHPADSCYDGSEYLCSEWAMDDHWHLVFANPRPLATPIPYKGQLGLWTLPDAVERAVLEQLAPPVPMDPDCRGGKHAACSGRAWDDELDCLTDCACGCHEGVRA